MGCGALPGPTDPGQPLLKKDDLCAILADLSGQSGTTQRDFEDFFAADTRFGQAKTWQNANAATQATPSKGVPTVRARVNGMSIQPLVDTGASVSVVRKDFLLSCFGRSWLKSNVRTTERSPSLVLGNGTVVSTEGQVTLRLTFSTSSTSTTEIEAHCWVFGAASYEVILGWDFMRAHNACVDAATNSLRVGAIVIPFGDLKAKTQQVYGPLTVAIQQDTWLRAGSEVLTEGTVTRWAGTATTGMLETDDTAITATALLARGPTNVDSQGRTKLLLANWSESDTLVLAGTAVGTFSPTDLADFNNIAVSPTDPAFRKELQDAIDSATGEEQRMQTQLPAMYLHQLRPRSGERKTTLPASLDLTKSHCSNEQRARLKSLLEKYADYFDDGEGLPRPARDVEFTVDLVDGAEPQKARGRQLPAGPRREEAETQVSRLLQMGAVRPSSSPWAASIVMVPKKGGKLRFCVDYRALNKLTKPLAYELPRIDVVLDSVGGAMWFSTVDAMAGYWQIPLAEKDKEKTAFNSPAGLLEWNVTPFGLMNVLLFLHA